MSYAQTNITLSRAIAIALKANPLLAAQAARVDAAQGLKEQAGLLPNPNFVFQSENTRLGWGGPFSYWNDTDNYLYLEQSIDIAGKRARRVDYASAGVIRSRLEMALLRHQVAVRTGRAYWNALVAERIRDLLRADLTNFEKVVQYHRHRVREGAMAETDRVRVEVERDRIELAAENAAVEAERAKVALLRDMGMDGDAKVVLTGRLDRIVDVAPIDLETAIERRPEVKLAEQNVAQARANVALQGANAFPDPKLVAGYKRTDGLDTIVFGVQVALPFFNRNQGQVVAANAELRAASSTLAAVRLRVRTEIEAALKEYRIRRKLTADVPPRMLAGAVETSRIARGAYLQGGTDLLRLLDAERTRIETEMLYSRTLGDYRQSATALQLALGMMP